MILAPVADARLRETIRRAALPEEDVFHRPEAIQDGLRFGFPRLFVCEAGDRRMLEREFSLWQYGPPVLSIAGATLRNWESTWEVEGLAVSRIDDSALRLRRIIGQTAKRSVWVEGVFADLTEILGRGLPPGLRGLSRRVLEFPSRYSSLGALGAISGASPGALKARFWRRGLPSPSRYLRWLRVITAARILSDPDQTTLTASYRLGFASDGNFCRWIQATSGLTPSALRDWDKRIPLLLNMAEECFPDGALEKWETLTELFMRRVA
jgi:AraC-like DNA-binding protein